MDNIICIQESSQKFKAQIMIQRIHIGTNQSNELVGSSDELH